MANIKVTVDDKAVNQRLQQLLQVVDKPRPLMLRVAETLYAQSMAMFEQQGFPANSWPSLRPSTIRSRSRAGHWPGKILQVTG
ncbi:phage virion morphogenesis protein, partial [Serratia marcescens]|nr:phage virion morphogenesis protein [Serratia marcescens]